MISRSMSVPDTGSMWDMHTSASQPSGMFGTVTGCACARSVNTWTIDMMLLN